MRAFTKLPVYLFGLTFLVVISCNQHQEKDAITLDSIRPHSSKKYVQNSAGDQQDTLRKYVNYYANDSAFMQISKVRLDSTPALHFIDRFSATRQKWILQDSNNVFYQYKQWHFKDSSACLEAFYNWLDQAGRQKESVKLFEGSISSANYELIIVGQQEVLFIEAPRNFNHKNWLLWYSGTKDYFPIKYALYVQPKKRTKWFKCTNNQIEAL